MAVTTTMTNGEVRAYRETMDVSQTELARELGIRRPSVTDFELYGKPMRQDITPSDAIDAIDRIAARKRAEK
jgi:DNA-binding transcriptional regulator YiaG